MIGALMVGLLFGCGALMVLTSQPLGAAMPPLSARLDTLRPDLPAKIDPPIVPVFRTFILKSCCARRSSMLATGFLVRPDESDLT